ncbi:hypothetical protein D8674_016992 [Pyrus ussuriensis x Pyrus communis]|uniref:Uncharacterized protein n=1 Tax=Pyrus ussuriensis x Pyrus communis TaxID=2448454 RepID=A0A5N5HGW5_9ROSA|nr:hypothetical protein D8674_016992 [Pyrus ussuriensis x Pyrus communis]
MAPKSRSACKSRKGIVIFHCHLNNLHRHQASLNLPIFFLEDGAHSLGPKPLKFLLLWKATCLPTKEGISAAKWSNFKRGFPSITDAAWLKWLIMMSKIIIPIKHELLSTAIIFFNNETNTFDFRTSPMTLTLSGRCVDIIHDWSSPS